MYGGRHNGGMGWDGVAIAIGIIQLCCIAQIYLNRFKYQNAEHSDLWDALTEAVPAQLHDRLGQPFSVKQFAKHWTEQTGYPVVQVGMGKNQNSQSQYHFEGSS